MAHVLKIIPKGFRTNTKVKTLSCMDDCNKNIQEKIKPTTKVKKELNADIFERENMTKKSNIGQAIPDTSKR